MKSIHFYNTKSNTILNQYIPLCLYKIGHITKAKMCLKFKVIYHALQGDNLYSENRQSTKNLIDCTHQMFFLLSFERNLCQD